MLNLHEGYVYTFLLNNLHQELQWLSGRATNIAPKIIQVKSPDLFQSLRIFYSISHYDFQNTKSPDSLHIL